jgi:hypothetical protein
MNSLDNVYHTTCNRVIEKPARRTPHQGTPHLHHLLNNIGGRKSKASTNTLMVNTPHVLGIYDMMGYKPSSKHDTVEQPNY